MRKLYLFILRSLCCVLLILRQKGVSYAIIFLIPGTVFCSEASAQVSITAPSLTLTTCGTFPTNYFALGNIIIKENSTSDFAVGSNVTLILSAPANFEFQAGQGSVSYISGNNISSATVAVTTNTITVTYSVSNTNRADQLTISGIMVRGITGVASNQTLSRTAVSSGTISGDVTGTVHATFSSQILPSPIVTTTAAQTSCSGSATAIALT